MAKVFKKPTPWRRINLSTNGVVTTVRYSEMSGVDLLSMLREALVKIPHCEDAMELALKYHKKDHPTK